MNPYHYAILKENDFTLFLHGACHVFALALHEHFGYSLFLLHDITNGNPKNATHVYCRFDDTHSVDVVGIAPEQTALNDLGWSDSKYRRMEVSLRELKGYFTISGVGGLCADREFLEVTGDRAQTRIAKCKDYYSGRIRLDIPGASRTQSASPKGIQQIMERE
jgi:hypothetical protein